MFYQKYENMVVCLYILFFASRITKETGHNFGFQGHYPAAYTGEVSYKLDPNAFAFFN